jgi:hypothetical protein
VTRIILLAVMLCVLTGCIKPIKPEYDPGPPPPKKQEVKRG